MFQYDVIIRTYNSSATLGKTITGVRSQVPAPRRVIVIDSGSVDDTLDIANEMGCDCHRYDGATFNYSRSLNQGLEYVDAPFVLVLSSHSILIRTDAVAAMHRCFNDPKVAASYIQYLSPADSVTVITGTTFNGYNGIWNVCSLYKTPIVKRLRFDESVPSCEDQHFAKRLYSEGLSTAAVGGRYLSYRNHRYSRLKDRNDYVSIAAYVFPEYMSWVSILRIARAGISAIFFGRMADSYDRLALAARLVVAKIHAPQFQSRYFKDAAR